MMKRLLIIIAFALAPLSAEAITRGPNKGVFGQTAATAEGVLIASDSFTREGAGEELLSLDGMWADREDAVKDGYLVHVDRANEVILSTTGIGGGALAAYTGPVTCSDYDTTMDVLTTVANGTSRVGVLSRYDKAADTGYNLRVEGDDELALLTRTGGGGGALLHEVSISGVVGSFSAATYYKIKLRAQGTTLSAYINDIFAFSVVDASFASGKPGVFITNTGPRGDNWEARCLP